MSGVPVVSTKPKLAVQYILDPRKLKSVPDLSDFYSRVRKTLRGMGCDLKEFGPEIDPDAIAGNALECSGQFAGFLGVTFTGTSARQTAVIGRFEGPVGVWYFPETPWWSMASAGSGLGYLRDEALDNPALRVSAIWGDPDDPATRERLERFARASHTVFAMKREKIGLIGGSYYDVMPASNWHPDILTNRLGPSYAEVEISLLERACESVTNAEVAGLVRRLKNTGMRVFEGEQSLEAIRMSARVSLAIEKLQRRFSLTGVALNCYGGPDPEGYTGVLGRCGASGCLKAHALGSAVMGCESDVVQCAQQMLFRHLVGRVPCMADPWKVDVETGVMTAATCSGPAELAGGASRVYIESGTLMSLYTVGVLGVCLPDIPESDAIVARIHGRRLDRMVIAKGWFNGSDNTTVPGRLSLRVKLDDPEGFLEKAAIGNHYTFLPTEHFDRDMARLEAACGFLGIEIERV
jgi:L-fucose isomerase-like protein